MYENIRDEWRIRDIESKVNECKNRLYEIDEAKRNVVSLECSVREACSCIDELRSTLEVSITRTDQLEQNIACLIEKYSDVAETANTLT